MNIAKKVFCRVYQFAFHLALPVLPYREPKILKDNTEIATEKDSIKIGAEKFIKKIKELNKNMGIPETISGIKEEDIKVMAKHADKEGNPLYPVPVLYNAKELEKFYYKVADWSK